jgi:hypothetical protein
MNLTTGIAQYMALVVFLATPYLSADGVSSFNPYAHLVYVTSSQTPCSSSGDDAHHYVAARVAIRLGECGYYRIAATLVLDCEARIAKDGNSIFSTEEWHPTTAFRDPRSSDGSEIQSDLDSKTCPAQIARDGAPGPMTWADWDAIEYELKAQYFKPILDLVDPVFALRRKFDGERTPGIGSGDRGDGNFSGAITIHLADFDLSLSLGPSAVIQGKVVVTKIVITRFNGDGSQDLSLQEKSAIEKFGDRLVGDTPPLIQTVSRDESVRLRVLEGAEIRH